MNKHIDFYKKISVKLLSDSAKAAGLDPNNPPDLQIFKKIINKRRRILEVGCGTGRLGKFLIDEYEYVGVDTNINYINEFLNVIKTSKKFLLLNMDFIDFSSGELFDVILFPWTVIGDFSEYDQEIVINKALELLNNDGIIILDNPAVNTVYNSHCGYEPVRFYYDEWVNKFIKLKINKFYKIEYRTNTGRQREITIIEK